MLTNRGAGFERWKCGRFARFEHTKSGEVAGFVRGAAVDG